MNIGFRHASGQTDHTASAELIPRSAKGDRPDYTLNNRAPGVRLQASWSQRPGYGGLELHWARGWGA
jgi:hypothetical protein